jgi:autotransporter passenger strand-loop-strand repeat protein
MAIDTTILSGGEALVLFAGTASGTMVSAGGTLFLSGGVGSDTLVRAAGTEILSGAAGSGALAISTIVSSGGTELLYGGSVASGTVISAGGYAIISNGGNESDTVVSTGGVLQLTDGGGGWYATILSGGALSILGGSVGVSTTVSSGGTESLAGGAERYTAVKDGGAEIVSAAGITSFTTISAGGRESVQSGGSASATTIDGGTLVLSAGAVTLSDIAFSGIGGALDIVDSAAVPATVISSFAASDSIDFGFLTSSAGDSYSVAGDIVTVSAGGHTYDLTIDGATAGGFDLVAGTQGELVLAVCYYPGTRIGTPGGAVAVERLAIGDAVITADGRTLPVRWIGRNTVSTRFADPLRVLPIRIRAGALAEGRPARDLLVSPEHALLVEAILIQAGALVNGLSILRERDVPESFTYYHVELAEHALILAEGTAAETFVDNVHRSVFDNWDEHEALYGHVPIAEMDYPRAQSHRQVPSDIHARLMARARLLYGDRSQQVA